MGDATLQAGTMHGHATQGEEHGGIYVLLVAAVAWKQE
jgi:hypothetical protein